MTKTQQIFMALQSAIEARTADIVGLGIDVAMISDTVGIEYGDATKDATVLMAPPEIDSWDSDSMDVRASFPLTIITRMDSGAPNVLLEIEIVGAIAAAASDVAGNCSSCSIGVVATTFNGRERLVSYRVSFIWNGMP